jgi:hypothetical protein
VVSEFGNVSEVTRAEAKVLSPIVLIEFPSVNEVIGEAKKAVSPIDVTELGIVTDLSAPVKSDAPVVKAPAPIEITDPSITSVPSHNEP